MNIVVETVDRSNDYERIVYNNVHSSGMQGDFFCVVHTVGGNTVEVLIHLPNIFRVTVNHDEDIVSQMEEQVEKMREEMEKEENAQRLRDRLTLPAVV